MTTRSAPPAEKAEKKKSGERSALSRAYWESRALTGRVLRAIPPPKTLMEIELRQPWVQAYGFQTVLDVGAHEGWFATLARRVFPAARILSFEPLPGCFEALTRNLAGDPRFEAFACALGASEGEAEMHRNDFTPSSSFLEMEPTHREAFPHTGARTTLTKVRIRTLDEVCRGRSLETPIFLKMDVQGFEEQVLMGGAETLARVDLVMLEVSLERLYAREPLFSDIHRRMVDAGFALAGFADVLRRPSDKKPLQVDVLFKRAAGL